MESQAKTQAIFEAQTQAKNFLLNWGPEVIRDGGEFREIFPDGPVHYHAVNARDTPPGCLKSEAVHPLKEPHLVGEGAKQGRNVARVGHCRGVVHPRAGGRHPPIAHNWDPIQ